MPKHAYGWLQSRPDHRDFLYAVPPPVLASLPQSVDLSQPPEPAPFEPAWDQSSLGSCGPHSAGEHLVFDMLKLSGVAVMPSRLFIYYVTRLKMGTPNQDSGVDNRTMLQALNQYGWCDEALWPYEISQFMVKPNAQCFTQAASRKITEYLSVQQSLNVMKGCIADGFPFIFGFTVYESFESQSVEQSGIVPMPTTRERVMGGHDVLIVGYDDVAGRFKFKNSWGPNWGNKGYGTIPYAYATSPRLSADFWTIRGSGYGPPPPPVGTLALSVPQAIPAGDYLLSPKG